MVKTSLGRFIEVESELKEGQEPALVPSLWERETVIISDTSPHPAENTGCVFEIQMSPKYSSLRVAEEKAYQYALPRSQDERAKPPRVEEKKSRENFIQKLRQPWFIHSPTFADFSQLEPLSRTRLAAGYTCELTNSVIRGSRRS